MAIAMAESLKDAAASQSELAELEQAIALSLALEAEQRRMALDAAPPAPTGSSGASSSTRCAAAVKNVLPPLFLCA